MGESDCYCESCKAKRGELSTIRHAAIRSYSYSPSNGWVMLAMPNDPFPYHMGVELETSINGSGERFIDNHMAADLRRPKTMWVAKHDGSVSGPEFASHPATLTYWQSKQSEIDEMFRLLLHGGYRSHNGGQAGMHVNISKAAFTDAKHLHRFLTFLYVNHEWTLVMSQRSEAQADRWAATRPYQLSDAERMIERNGYRSPTHKYSVIHAPYSQGRLEFRLPRGTLRVDRFYKNLEWTAAMVAWTRSASNVLVLGPGSFMDWAEGRALYSNLNNYIAEKASALEAAIANDTPFRAMRTTDCGYRQQDQTDGEATLTTPANDLGRPLFSRQVTFEAV
jgi:hypothetical protein